MEREERYRFLFAVWPFAGHFFPTVAIAQALRARGHRCAFYSGVAARPAIEREGFRCFPFESIDEAWIEEIMLSREVYVSRRRPLQLQALLRDWLLESLPGQVTDLRRLLQQWQPDVLISETSMLGPMLVLQETQPVPVAVFSTVVACLLPGQDVPPFGPGLPPNHGWTGRVLAGGIRLATRVLGTGFRRRANQLRAEYGLPPLEQPVTAYTGTMPLYLIPGLREFDYNRRDLPPSVHYVGSCLWNDPGPDPEPQWLAEMPTSRPVIHVSEGTMHTRTPLLLDTAARALADFRGYVIMTTGGNRRPEEIDIGLLPGHIRLEQWVSHRRLLPKTDVLVTTGGAGTVMSALANGVPLVLVPTDWDKPENAQRVVEAGLGLRVPLPRLNARRLRAAIERVLSEPHFKENAVQFAMKLRAQDGPVRAAQLLEELAATRRTTAISGVVAAD